MFSELSGGYKRVVSAGSRPRVNRGTSSCCATGRTRRKVPGEGCPPESLWFGVFLGGKGCKRCFRRRLEEHRQNGGAAERPSPLQPSQAHVLGTKPNYQQILDEQGEVLSFMELVVSSSRLFWAENTEIWGRGLLQCFSTGFWFCSWMSCSKRCSCCGGSARTASATSGASRSSSVSGTAPVWGVDAAGGSLLGVNGVFPPCSSRQDLPEAGELPRAQAHHHPAQEAAAAGGLRGGSRCCSQ